MLADQFDAFFLDLDGVVYISNEVLPYAQESIQRLRTLGKKLRFLTNNPCRTRTHLRERLQRIGIALEKEEMMTSLWATCLYLRQQGISRIYHIGSQEALIEFAEAGIEITDIQPEAVVVGCEKSINYEQLQRAQRYIRQGALFIATAADAWYPSKSGPMMGTGALLAAIQTSSEQRPFLVGKPSPTMFLEACLSLGSIDRARVVMIGDTPSSDILGAHQAGLSALLISPLAPETRIFPGTDDLRQPDALIPHLAALFDQRYTLRPWQPVSYSWPQSIVPAVAALVFDAEGRILLCRPDEQAQWELPAASIELGETITAAVQRIVQTTTGLVVTIENVSGVYSEPTTQIATAPTGEIIQSITTALRCRPLPAQEHLRNSATRLFVDVEQFPAPLHPVHRQWIYDALHPSGAAIIR